MEPPRTRGFSCRERKMLGGHVQVGVLNDRTGGLMGGRVARNESGAGGGSNVVFIRHLGSPPQQPWKNSLGGGVIWSRDFLARALHPQTKMEGVRRASTSCRQHQPNLELSSARNPPQPFNLRRRYVHLHLFHSTSQTLFAFCEQLLFGHCVCYRLCQNQTARTLFCCPF
jgi:hypothetical protein